MHSLTYKFYKDNRMVTTNNITSVPCNLTQKVREPKWLLSFNLTGAIFSLWELWLPCSRVFIFTAVNYHICIHAHACRYSCNKKSKSSEQVKHPINNILIIITHTSLFN